MPIKNALHPVVRYAAGLLCFAAALGLLLASARVSLHSAPWLVGVFTTAVLLLVTLRSAKESGIHRSFALYLLMLNQYLIVVWLLHYLVPHPWPALAKEQAAFWAWLLYPGLIFNAVAHYHFTLRFAESKSSLLHAIEIVGWAISVIFIITNLFGFFIDDYRWAGVTWVPTLTGVYGIFFPITTFYLSVGIVAPLYGLMTNRSRQRRLQLIYYLVGAAPLWLTCWGNFLISWGINIYPAGGLLFLLHVAIIAYAVLWHRIFDFAIVIRRGLAYAGVSLILGMLYGSAIWASRYFDSAAAPTISSIVFVLLVGVICAPLWNYLQQSVDQLFFRTAAAREMLLQRLARESAASVKLETVASALLGTLNEAFLPRSISLFLHDEKEQPTLFAQYQSQVQLAPWPDSQPLNPSLASLYRRLDKPEFIPASRSESQAPVTIAEREQALLVPLRHGDQLLGCLLLEPRKADEPYSDEDMEWIEAAAASISTALLNARAFARLEQVQAFTTRTLDGLSAAVFVIAQSGSIVQSNRMAQRLCLPAASPRDLQELALVHPRIGARLQELLSGGRETFNEDITIPSDPERNLLLTTAPLGIRGNELVHLVILHEVTDYKRLENVARRHETLAKLGEAISSINHEVKNVVQPIRYQVNLLTELNAEDRTTRRAVQVIHDRVHALEVLIANLRDLSRPIELRIRRIDLNDMLQSIWLDLKVTPSAAGVALKLELGAAPDCDADGHWLRLVLNNLVKNAVEATVGRRDPELRIRSYRSGQAVHIRVTDNGAGIDSANYSRLFNLFFSTKGESGTGLGLSVSRRIIELHGGQLEFESALDAGTTFTIQLPLGERSGG